MKAAIMALEANLLEIEQSIAHTENSIKEHHGRLRSAKVRRGELLTGRDELKFALAKLRRGR